MDQSPSRGIGRQNTATVIFNRECPKVVDRFRYPDKVHRTVIINCVDVLIQDFNIDVTWCDVRYHHEVQWGYLEISLEVLFSMHRCN